MFIETLLRNVKELRKSGIDKVKERFIFSNTPLTPLKRGTSYTHTHLNLH